MAGLNEIEECIFVNAGEMSPLWSILADWTKSEDEEKWVEYEPDFAKALKRLVQLEYVEVYIGPEWPAHVSGRLVPAGDVGKILDAHESWKYSENPDVVIGLSLGRNSSLARGLAE